MLEELFGNFSNSVTQRSPVAKIEDSPGRKLKDMGAKPKHPVVIIPGIITSGLESWGLDNCSKKYFRQRIWGTMNMFKTVLTDKQCWVDSLKLDPVTGLDNGDYKLRAAQGLDAADYFVTGYWVWAKLIENFAILGYDNNNMHLAAYDWRLSYANLEKRDSFFSKLKNTIERAKIGSGEKLVVLSHSMGGSVWYYFLKWVESDNGGKGGKNWVEDHIHASVNIAGSLLGALKTIPSLLSGEQRETVQPMAQYILERYFSRQERAELFRSWGGLWSLIPKGGEHIWGNHEKAADDIENHVSHGNFLLFPTQSTLGHNFTVDEAIQLLKVAGGEQFTKNLEESYSFGAALNEDQIRNDDPAAWSNPLETNLPNAPSMKYYCLYGYGLPTERSYHYDETPALEELDESRTLKYIIDNKVNDLDSKSESGVRSGLGDGSVQLLSLGYMCVKGWKKKLYNPSGLKVITREFKHKPVAIYEDIRGGPETGEHVDILGNYGLTMDIMQIATGFDTQNITDRIESDILSVADKVPL
ncbi:Lecithin:cholesterol acyltransferase [Neoconidiobolus thromboides FSU 785]|nr:Lecithin:cholesterol acyltransferase [Neoconidiobolus thromboides FSU 785]